MDECLRVSRCGLVSEWVDGCGLVSEWVDGCG